MKNKFQSLSLKFMLISVISFLISTLIIIFTLWASYKIFNLEGLRNIAHWLYRIFDVFVINYPAAFIFPFIILLAFCINYLFTIRMTKRLNAVMNAVFQIQNGEYHVLLPNENSDSLGELEQCTNALAIKISDTFKERKEIEQSKDDFIINIAHDLRTPLTSIIGYLSFISEKQLDPNISSKYAGIALEKSQQLETLIDSLFDIAHLTTNSIEIEKKEIDLNKFLMQKQDEFYPQLHSAEMEIRLKLSESVSKIQADGALMARVFDNLINNAIRYANEGHYIDIETKRVSDKIFISFITFANPVPINELEKVFDKLYRLEKSRAGGTGGTGLGLFISRRIIELHNGTLIARQTENGTAFDISLPQ